MVSLATAGKRFQKIYTRLDGLQFAGAIMPVEEGRLPVSSFNAEPLILRVDPECPIATKDIIIDLNGRHFLVMDHGENDTLYRTHRLQLLQRQVTWSRQETITDPVTNLPKGTGTTDLGPIWVSIEGYGREPFDLTMRIKEQIRRLVTGYDIQLGDKVDDMIVKRLDSFLGVWVAEIQ